MKAISVEIMNMEIMSPETLAPMAAFFTAIEKDPRISVTHIGLYAALLQYWQAHGCPSPLQVFSHQIMLIAKLSAPATYHKCIRDLDAFGYIRYEPCFKRNKGSKVYLSLYSKSLSPII